MKNKNDGYGQAGMLEKQGGNGSKEPPALTPALSRSAAPSGVAPGRNDFHGGFKVAGLVVLATLALALAGCSSMPHTTIAGKLNGSPFLIEAPKDGDLTGFDLTADSNGVVRVHIDHLAVKMNPDVIAQSGAAQAGIIQATGVVASNITAAAVAAALRAD
jgi:hypothetical protein